MFSVTRHRIENVVRNLQTRCPLPEGYQFALESHGGLGDGKRYYSLAVVRKDRQGGDFIDIPGMGGLTARSMYWQLIGMLDGLEWRDRLAKLPKV